MKIIINFPLKIENLLPFPLNIRIGQFEKKDHESNDKIFNLSRIDSANLIPESNNLNILNSIKMKERTIESGVIKNFSSINVINNFSLSISILNYDWSNNFMICFNLNESKEIKKKDFMIFQLFSNTNDQINIILEKNLDKSSFNLTFFSEFWFMNETSHPILLKVKESNYVYGNIKLYNMIKYKNLNQIDNIINVMNIENLNNEDSYVKEEYLFQEGLEGISYLKNNSKNDNKFDSELFAFNSSFFSKKDLDDIIQNKYNNLRFFSGNVENLNKKFKIQFDKISDWSNYMLFEESEKITHEINLKENKNLNDSNFNFNVSIFKLPEKFYRTTLILFSPKYLLINKTEINFEIKQKGKEFMILKGQSSLSLMEISNIKDPYIYMRIRKNNYLWSSRLFF